MGWGGAAKGTRVWNPGRKLGGSWIKGSGQDEGIDPRLGFLAHFPFSQLEGPWRGDSRVGRA